MLEDILDFENFKIVDGSVHPLEYKALISFFSDLEISIDDITSEQQKNNNQKVVIANYYYNNRVFKTNPLYYKHVNHSPNVKEAGKLISYFGEDTYWLDIDIHKWPKPKGETDIDSLIINDMTANLEFRSFLKMLANNNSRGIIQRITKAGRSNQYFRNLENNSHWHDLILMIKECIKHQGNVIDKKFYKSLVFKWDGNKNTERLRSSLSSHFGDRLILQKLSENITNCISMQAIENNNMINNCVKLLKYKKQIILQGAPGTGKTRLAKKIASEMSPFSYKDISNLILVGDIIPTYKGVSSYIVKTVDQYNIVLIGDRNKNIGDKKISFAKILKCYYQKKWLSEIENGDERGACAIAYHLSTKFKSSEFIKLLQFHPSYTYEDFVRGIVSKPNDDGDGIFYEAENKILADFAKKALNNYNESQRNTLVKNNKDIFDAFIEFVKEELAQSIDHKYPITEAVYLFTADETRFKYKGDKWVAHKKGLNMKFSELKKIIDSGAKERQDVKRLTELEELSRQHATYFIKVVEKFRKFKDQHKSNEVTSETVELKNFVLIIDEINRANLSSVLGELIYALEYRGEEVESMYEVDGSNKLVLPPNLYIIGTMNTADRSVGHIDYAIRRRFAFVDILPKNLKETDGLDSFDENLFGKVASLFDENLSPEFEKNDVQLGHSYFIDKSDEEHGADMNMRWNYEIKPILLEYVKDGILVGENIRNIIESLKTSG